MPWKKLQSLVNLQPYMHKHKEFIFFFSANLFLKFWKKKILEIFLYPINNTVITLFWSHVTSNSYHPELIYKPQN